MSESIRQLVQRTAQKVAKKYKDAVCEVASKDLVRVSQWASTGSFALDRAIAGAVPGGVPLGPKRGRVLHLFGDKSLGKSILLDCIFLSVQRAGGICIVQETEGTRDPVFAEQIGLKLDEIIIQRPNTIEEMVDMGMDQVAEIRAARPDIPIVLGVDSIELVEAGRTFGVKMSGKEGGAHQFGGGRAAALGAACRKMANVCSRSPVDWILLNQVREAIAVMFGNKKKPGGGMAVGFMASVEVQLTSSKYGMLKDAQDHVTGRWIHAKVVKNKLARPFAQCDFLISFDRGVDQWAGVFESLEQDGLVKKQDGGREFGDTATGEVLPMREFVRWCQRTGALAKPLGAFGKREASSSSTATT